MDRPTAPREAADPGSPGRSPTSGVTAAGAAPEVRWPIPEAQGGCGSDDQRGSLHGWSRSGPHRGDDMRARWRHLRGVGTGHGDLPVARCRNNGAGLTASHQLPAALSESRPAMQRACASTTATGPRRESVAATREGAGQIHGGFSIADRHRLALRALPAGSRGPKRVRACSSTSMMFPITLGGPVSPIP